MYLKTLIKSTITTTCIIAFSLICGSVVNAQPLPSSDLDQVVTTTQQRELKVEDAVDTKGPFADWGIPTPLGIEDSQHPEEENQDQTLGEATSEIIALGNGWYRQSYQNGDVYTKEKAPTSRAIIKGEIRDKWMESGAEGSDLGYPISNEFNTSDGIGKFSVFEGGLLYSHPEHGTHPVSGPVLRKWADSGFEQGSLGYPIEDAQKESEGLVLHQAFEQGELTEYAKVVQDITNETPGAEGKLTPEQVWRDGVDFAKQQNIPLTEAFHSALEELRVQNSQQQVESESFGGLPDGVDKDPTDPINRGDIFYSDAVSLRYNHGHVGIFVGDPKAPDHKRNDTIEASGVIEIGSSAGEEDPDAGVKRRANYNDDTDQRPRDSEPRLRNPVNLIVNTDQATRNRAADWAEEKAGDGYDTPKAGYNYNFAFNKRDDGKSYNCSQLVWAAFGNASGLKVDLDSNGGTGVYPMDIYKSELVVKSEGKED